MYKTIVRRRVIALFNQANNGNWQAIIDALDDQFLYRFVGDTPLGGIRTKKPAMAVWFKRVYKFFPGSKFYPDTIVVMGMPWNTKVMTYVRIRGTQPSTQGHTLPYENEFMQLLKLRWGRITSVITIEDTQRFVDLLPKLVAAGITDASAAAVSDDVQ